MKTITGLTDQYQQIITIQNEDNTTFLLNLYFSTQQQSWFYGIEYGGYVSQSQRLVVGPNILRRQKNILPFGIMVISTDQLDPFLLIDFISGRISLFLLTPEEVIANEVQFFSPPTP